jgi:hypothetical protein
MSKNYKYFPMKLIRYAGIVEGSLGEFGIDVENNGSNARLVTRDGKSVAMSADDDGHAIFLGKIPNIIQNAIANRFKIDNPFFRPQTHVVVDGLKLLDVDFAIEFLTRAKGCDELLRAHLALHPALRDRLMPPTIESIEFAAAANTFVRKAHRRRGAFSLDLQMSSWTQVFVVMYNLGFFRNVELHYEMTIPPSPTIGMITDAIISLLETDDGGLHPERHLVTLTDYSAKYHRKRISKRRTYNSPALEAELDNRWRNWFRDSGTTD